MHSIFEIGEIHQINERLWQVELLSTINNDKRMTELTDYIRQHTTKSETHPWFRLAELFLQMGHHDEAEGILQQFADFCLTYAPDSMSYAKCLHGLGLTQQLQGDFSKALSLFEQALQIYTIPDKFRATVYNDLGKTHFSVGNYSTALLNYKKSLEILETIIDSDLRPLILCYAYIGETYLRLGKARDAQFYVKKAIAIGQKVFPSVHPHLAIWYTLMGEAYRMTADFTNATQFYEKALKIKEKYLPPDHVELGHTLSELGLLNEKLNNYSSALSYHEKALQIRNKSLSSNHPDL
ncbi:unnamed protein product, partial [Adineta steineri]